MRKNGLLLLLLVASLFPSVAAQDDCQREVCPTPAAPTTPTADGADCPQEVCFPSSPTPAPEPCQTEVCFPSPDSPSGSPPPDNATDDGGEIQAPYDITELRLDAASAANGSGPEPVDPTTRDFVFLHPDDERDVGVINVTDIASLLALHPKGNGTEDAPWELDHLAIASKDEAAVRIENVSGYVKIDNMSLAGTRGVYAANVGHLTIIDVNLTAGVHGIEAQDVGLLSVSRTNVTALEFGVWVKKGQGYLDRVNVRGARDGVVLDRWAAKVTFLHIEARRSGFVATDSKGIFQNIIVTKCKDKGITLTGGGDLTLIGMAAACGEIGVEVVYARSLDLEGALVQDARVGVSLRGISQASVREVYTTRIENAALLLVQTPADIARVRLGGGGGSGILAVDSDLTLNNLTLDGFSRAAIELYRCDVVAQVFDITGSTTGILMDASKLRVAYHGGDIGGSSIGIDATRSALGGVGVIRVHDGVGESIGAKLTQAYDAARATNDTAAPFDWAGIDVDRVDQGMVLDDQTSIRMMGMRATDVAELITVRGHSTLHMTKALDYVRPAGAWIWKDIERLIRVEDRSFLDMNNTQIEVHVARTLVDAVDSYVNVNGSRLSYDATVAPHAGGSQVRPPASGGTQEKPAPGAGAPVGDLTMFRMRGSSIRVNYTTLFGGDVLLDLQGMLSPTKGNLSEANFAQLSALVSARKTAILGEDTALYVRSCTITSADPTYEYGVRLTGDSALRIDAVPNDALPGGHQVSVIRGATKEDLLWDPPTFFPLSTISPPKDGDLRHTNVSPLIMGAWIGKARMRDFTTDHNVTLYQDHFDRLALEDTDLRIFDTVFGATVGGIWPPDQSNPDLGLIVNHTKAEKILVVSNVTANQITIEKFGANTYVQSSQIGSLYVRNTTAPGPAIVANSFNTTRPEIHLENAPARLSGNRLGLERGNGTLYAGSNVVGLDVERSTDVLILNNTFPDRMPLLWNRSSGVLARNNISGILTVLGSGAETLEVTDNLLVDGSIRWTDTKGIVAFNDFTNLHHHANILLHIRQVVGHAPATPDIIGNSFNVTYMGISIASGNPALGEVGPMPQYERAGRIANNVFYGYGTPVDSQHGDYRGNDENNVPIRVHEESRGVRVEGNTFVGGVNVPCHRYLEPYTVFVDGKPQTNYRQVKDGQFDCAEDPNATLSLATHYFRGAASGVAGPRPPPKAENVTAIDPANETGAAGTGTRSRDTFLAAKDTSNNTSPLEVTCQGYALRRVQLKLTPLSFRHVAASGTVDVAVEGDWYGKMCDDLFDVKLEFIDNGTVIQSGTRAQEVITFQYLPQTGNLTLRASLASKGPNGTQQIELTQNLTGIQASIGFIPIPNATYLDPGQTSRILDALSKVLSPAEFQGLVAAVIAAFAIAGLDFKYDIPKGGGDKGGGSTTDGKPDDAGPGAGWNKPTSNYYLALAGQLDGVNEKSWWKDLANKATYIASFGFSDGVLDAESASQGRVFAATALWGRDQIVAAFTATRGQMANLDGMSDAEKLAWIKEKRASVGGKAESWDPRADWSSFTGRDPILGMATDGSTLIALLKSPYLTDAQILDGLNKGIAKGIPAMDEQIAHFKGLNDLGDMGEVFDARYSGVLKAAAGHDPRAMQALDMGQSVSSAQAESAAVDKGWMMLAAQTGLAVATLGGSVALEVGIIEAGGMGELAVAGLSQAQNVWDAGVVVSNVAHVWNAAGDVYGGPNVLAPVLGSAGDDAARARLAGALDEAKSEIGGVLIGRAAGAVMHYAIPAVAGAVGAVTDEVGEQLGLITREPIRAPRVPEFGSLREPGIREPTAREPTPIIKQPEGTLAHPAAAGEIGAPKMELGGPRGIDIDVREPVSAPSARSAHASELESAIEKEWALAKSEAHARDSAAMAERPREAPQPSGERDAAVKASGMTPDHAEAASKVAAKNDAIILTQKTNPAATPEIEAGAFTKDMHVKGKSADAGDASGYIPIDQRLSKAGTIKEGHPDFEKYGGSDGVIDHYNAEVKKTLDLTAEGKKPMLVEITDANGQPRTVQVKYTEMEIVGKESGEPVKVLGKQFIDPETGAVLKQGPVTADVDMLAIGTKKPQMLQIPDEHMGDLTKGTRDIVREGNIESGRGDNPIYHHGSAGSASMNPGINYPITAYEPNGAIRSIPEGPKTNPDMHLKEYFNEMEGKGYHPDTNKLWGWQRDANGKWDVSKPNLDAKTASGELPPEWGGKDYRPETPAAPHDAPHATPAPEAAPRAEGGTYDYKTDPFADEPDIDPMHAALAAGVKPEAIARVEGIAATRAPELADQTNIRSTALDRLRLAEEGHDPYFLHTPAGKVEYQNVAQATVHANQGGLTDADVSFLRGKIAADPQFLDKLPLKGRVLEDGDWLPVAPQQDVALLRQQLEARGVHAPAPVPSVRATPSDVRIEDTMPHVRDGKYVAPVPERVVRPPIQVPEPAADESATVIGLGAAPRKMELE